MSFKYYFFLSSLLQYLKGTSGQQIPLSEKEVIYIQESVRSCPELKTGSKWYAAHYAQLLSRIWLFGAPWTPAGSCVHGIFQAKILEWIAVTSSRRSSPTRDWTLISCLFCIGRKILYHWAIWEAPSVIYPNSKSAKKKKKKYFIVTE